MGRRMSELGEKVKASIERLKAFCPPEGFYLAFSGGKDSVVCKALLDMAGCKYDATYRITSVDPPELVRFIKEKHPDVKREYPRYSDGSVITMWNLIPRKLMPPTRIARYCCSYLKESGGDGRVTVTGVRWAESVNRKKKQGLVTIMAGANKSGGIILINDNDETRRMVESCYKRQKTNVNPIIDWTDAEVWEFIHSLSIPYCGLYDDGFNRLGCIGCPMAQRRGREQQFLRWPKYKSAYLRSFRKMIENRESKGKPAWGCGGTGLLNATAMDVFRWWMEYDTLPGQMDLMEDYDE